MILSFLYLGRIVYRDGLALQHQLVELATRSASAIRSCCSSIRPCSPWAATRTAAHPRQRRIPRAARRRGSRDQPRRRRHLSRPGQLVGYPILDLRSYQPAPGRRRLRAPLEEVLIRTCADFGVLTAAHPRTHRRLDAGPAAPSRRRSRCDRRPHLARHHLARLRVNVTTDLRDFELIVPCGIADRAYQPGAGGCSAASTLNVATSGSIGSAPAPGARRFWPACFRDARSSRAGISSVKTSHAQDMPAHIPQLRQIRARSPADTGRISLPESVVVKCNQTVLPPARSCFTDL